MCKLPPVLKEYGMNSESYRIAGIDVHKEMLAVVVADVGGIGEYRFQRRKFGTTDSQLKEMAEWLRSEGVEEAVMESTAQYWKPVWRQLEPQCELHLAQAKSNRAPRGRKQDYQDAERLVRRHVAGELILSFVPDAEQRLWRILSRTRQQLTRDRIRLYNQLESFLEDARLKLGICVTDLLGVSSLRMLRRIADGETDPAQLAKLADANLKASQGKLIDALRAVDSLKPLQRHVLKMFLERMDLIDTQIKSLQQELSVALSEHQDAVMRLAKIPGLGPDSAQQIIAEVGPEAGTFPAAENLASWVGVCPGREESAEVSKSNRSPKGNCAMRRLLNQAANAAIKTKGSWLQIQYRRLVVRLGHKQAIWAIAHRLCTLVWIILHRKEEYIEYGQERSKQALKLRTTRQLRELRALGYQIIPPIAIQLA
jgi:transposase